MALTDPSFGLLPSTNKVYQDPGDWGKFYKSAYESAESGGSPFPGSDSSMVYSYVPGQGWVGKDLADYWAGLKDTKATPQTPAPGGGTGTGAGDWSKWLVPETKKEAASTDIVTAEKPLLTPEGLADSATRESFMRTVMDALKKSRDQAVSRSKSDYDMQMEIARYQNLYSELNKWDKAVKGGQVIPLPQDIVAQLPYNLRQAYEDIADKASRFWEATNQKPESPALSEAIVNYAVEFKDNWTLPVYSDTELDEKTGEPLIDVSKVLQNNYGVAYFDEEGNRYTTEELQKIVITDPNKPINAAYALGGGLVFQLSKRPDGNFLRVMDALGYSGEDVVKAGEISQAETADAWRQAGEATYRSFETNLLKDVNAGNYRQKAMELSEFYQKMGKKPVGQRDLFIDALNTVEEAMSPEEMKKARDLNDAGRAAAEAQAEFENSPEAQRQKALRDETEVWNKKYGLSLSPDAYADTEQRYAATLPKVLPAGISMVGNYPYITPLSNQDLVNIPADVLEIIASYLETKGLSWSDFLSISDTYFGGGENYGGSFRIPYQWS